MRRSNVNDKQQSDQIMQTNTPPANWRGGGGGGGSRTGEGGDVGAGGGGGGGNTTLNITRATNSPAGGGSTTSASYTPTNPSQKNDTNGLNPLNTNTSSTSSPNLLGPDYDDNDEEGGNRQSYLSTTSSGGTPGGGLNGLHNNSFRYGDKKKIGHRVVKDGVVHYKKVSTDELKKSIQFGIVHFLNEQIRDHIDRDLLMQDFQDIKQYEFKKFGSALTPAHNFSDFKLKVYAPYGFKYLRRKFNVNEVDFMHSIGETDLIEIGNPGASGSVFYKTSNDKYIIKTVQLQECEFLRSLLAGYALNLLQNIINSRFTLLPTIFGLFMYQKYELTSFLSDKTNIRVVIMNNLLPTDVQVHEQFDLKGSLYKRKASKEERAKASPTFKDLDFLEIHPEGLSLDEKHYDNIISSIKRDCLVLESFSIMDYSLLLGIHNLERDRNNIAIEAYYEAKVGDLHISAGGGGGGSHMDSSQSGSNHYKSSLSSSTARNWDNFFNISAVPARSSKGDRLLLYIGIIDILQSYRLKKRLEHTIKSMITDGSQISVCNPKYYAARFIEFMTTKVFKKATLKSSPARKRLTFRMDNKSAVPDEASQLSPMSERASQSGDHDDNNNNSASPGGSTYSQSRRNTVESKPFQSSSHIKTSPRILEASTPTTPPPPIPAVAAAAADNNDGIRSSKHAPSDHHDRTFADKSNKSGGGEANKFSLLIIPPSPLPPNLPANTSSLSNSKNLDSSSSSSSAPPPTSQSTPVNVASSSSNATSNYSRFNLKSLKPIDSVDSVSGLLLPKSDSKSAMLNKFTSHTEEAAADIDSSSSTTGGYGTTTTTTYNTSSSELPRQTMPRSDSNRLFKYANDNESMPAPPPVPPSITPIIRHYEFKKSNEHMASGNNNISTTSSNRSIHTAMTTSGNSPSGAPSSLAIRIQTHSPVQLLSSNSLMSHSASSSGMGYVDANHVPIINSSSSLHSSPLKSASSSHAAAAAATTSAVGGSSNHVDQTFNGFDVTYRQQTRIKSYQIHEEKNNGSSSTSNVYNAKDIEIITHL